MVNTESRKISTVSRKVNTGSIKISTGSKITPESKQAIKLDQIKVRSGSTTDGSTQINDESRTNTESEIDSLSTKVNLESTKVNNVNTESLKVKPTSTQKGRIIKIKRRRTSELDGSSTTSAGMENIVLEQSCERISDHPEESRSPVFIPEPDARTMLQAMLVSYS